MDVWVPLSMIVELGGLNTWAASDRNARFLDVVVRRKRGVTIEQASAELVPIASSIARTYPKTHAGVTATMVPVWKAQSGAQAILLKPLRILMVACALLFLIACANVANLLLARSIARKKEFGIRMAMGAGRWRIIRQLLTEVVMVSGAGAIAGLLLAQWATDILKVLLPTTDLPLAGMTPEGAVSGRVLAFTLFACLATALLSAIVPAWFSTRVSVNETLKEGGRSGTAGVQSHRTRDVLVGFEVALAAVALIGAGLFARSFQNARTLDPGFDSNNVLVARLYLSAAGYSLKDERLFDRQLRRRLEVSAGVENVSYAEWVPLWFGSPPSETVHVEGYAPSSDEVLKVHRMIVAPGYFRLMRIPLLAGRDFTEQDDSKGQPVLIATEAFAKRYFDGREPIGRRVRLGGLHGGSWFTVVGVVRDSMLIHPGESPLPSFYVPFEQMFFRGHNNFVYIRAAGDANSLRKVIRQEIAALGAGAGLYDVMPLSEYMQGAMYPLKVAAMLLTVLGALSLSLTAGGMHSVMAYAVTERTREIGVRMALGAQPRQVLGMVLRKGLTITLSGLAAGVVIAVAGARVVANQLVGMSPLDLRTFLEASVFLCGVSLVAAYLPAQRATKVDPMTALRCQ
jgi:predicted permease